MGGSSSSSTVSATEAVGLSEEMDRHGLSEGGVAGTAAGTPTTGGIDAAAGVWPIRPRRMRCRRPRQDFARKGDPFPLISTIATVGGDEGDEEQQIKQCQQRISGDVRDGAAAARATVLAVRPTEHRCTGERK
jgi:hypothetical protein